MTSLTANHRTTGFQGSETSSAELVVYANDLSDPVLIDAGDQKIEFLGRRRGDSQPSLLSLSTSKRMGAAAGTWAATVKSDRLFGRDLDLRDVIVDDQWVDITFLRHNRPWHTMRGQVDRVQKTRVATGGGVTTTAYTITGRDFGKIWDITPIWFNRYARQNVPGENIAGAAVYRIFTELQNAFPEVDDAVKSFLFNFIQALGDTGRANWAMPRNMPNVKSSSSFIENVHYDVTEFSNDPPRRVSMINFLDPDGAMAWALAQEWSDPVFCELYTDTLPVLFTDVAGLHRKENLEQIPISETGMFAILRDRPFPTLKQGFDSPWFKLPMAIVDRHELVQDDVGRGGEERFNAYFVSSQLTQELVKNDMVDITAPLWDPADILVHGLRRFDVNSRYVADLEKALAEDSALLTLTKSQRLKCRDWYTLNPYFLSGSLVLGHGRPDIHIGTKVRIPGLTKDLDETYYVEQVDNSWQFGAGIRTTLGVTRGWVGSDASLMDTLLTQSLGYTGSERQADIDEPSPPRI